jgi:hypothetical protein
MVGGGSLVCAAGFALLTHATRRKVARGGRPHRAGPPLEPAPSPSDQRGHGGLLLPVRAGGWPLSRRAASTSADRSAWPSGSAGIGVYRAMRKLPAAPVSGGDGGSTRFALAAL